MTTKLKKYNLQIDQKLLKFINEEILKELNIDEDHFWNGFSTILNDLGKINNKLINKRKIIQLKINDWFKQHKGSKFDLNTYKKFLIEIGYIVEEDENFKIDIENVDPEISTICGPQLVVPITNARYALNAVNSRWGSFYDALYGTDALGTTPKSNVYESERGRKVIKYAKTHLDKITPLSKGSWNDIEKIQKEKDGIKFYFNTNRYTTLNDIEQIAGLKINSSNRITELILIKNNLHIRIIINPEHQIGKNDSANISDIILESAISTILDCEDSVATVDAEDKILAYQNWLGLMKGDLEAKFAKNGKTITRSLNNDIKIQSLKGEEIILKGRSLMLIRNVGHLIQTPMILDQNDDEVYEGLVDAVITSIIALFNFNKKESKNSIYDSLYIVKPKMHGPEEVSFACKTFDEIEKLLKMPKNSIKIGIMDEEKRTSVNLKECIRAAKSRVAFINTGFLDRTGDEIHTSMHAGPFIKKGEMKKSVWINAYENRNVEIGLECGLQGKAQIGKGMWAMPDLMLNMLEHKVSHPKAGANCAWVPSPTAATLHATHYHNINVFEVQNNIKKNKSKSTLDDLLTLPLLDRKNLSAKEVLAEIENNAQGILGYVVRWIDQGIGCSKVPDINNIGLMEDRATCRISSQAITNWLTHGIINEELVLSTFKKMAVIVDKQNKNDPHYIQMSPNFNTLAFKAAIELVLRGLNQPSGYTEPILYKKRLEFKSTKIN